MGKIVAIGGGEIGRPGTAIQTREIDEEIISLTGKKNPNVLFIPTASSDSEDYSEVFKNYYQNKLGCQVSILNLINNNLLYSEIETKILNSDIIYVGGGNTLKMMNLWKKLSVDKILHKAYDKNIVLSGLSAGSICWFSYGNPDSRKFTSGSNKLIKVSGLGFINALHCPHYDNLERQIDLKNMMKKTYGIVSIALDGCTALEVIDNKYRIIKSDDSAKAYKIYWKNNLFNKEEIFAKKEFSKLDELLNK